MTKVMNFCKTHLRLLTVACIMLTLCIILLFMGMGGGNKNTAVRTITLEQQTLRSTVGATGTVYSSQSTQVYSNLNYPVGTVLVSVGDQVAEGDVLAVLDTSALESDIAQKKASLNASQAKAQQNLAAAKKDLENAESNLENNINQSMLNAKSQEDQAWMSLVNARENLSDAEDSGADAATISRLETARDNARKSYNTAKANLEAAEATANQQLETYRENVETAKLSANFNDQLIYIKKLEEDLARGTITAPVSGTVTAVNAVAGGSGSGQLFVIQTTESLKVVTSIKEYDVASVSVGDKVSIKADATGDRVFEGVLSKIAPTSTLTAAGAIQSSTDAEYQSEVSVNAGSQGLRIGMNARLSIITQEKEEVYAVPYEAVGVDENGESFVYIAAEQEDGSFVVEMLTVETGMETDLYVEIFADSLTDGMRIIKSIDGIRPGMAVVIES